MASFKAKIGWKWGLNENKNYHSIRFLPNALQKIPKKQQKNYKNLKILLWFHYKPKQVGKGRERAKMKIVVSFHSYLKPNRKFKKIVKKLKKILLWFYFKPKQVLKCREREKIKIPSWHLLKPQQVEKGRGREKIKIIVPFRSNMTPNRKFQKNSKKIQKIEKYHYSFISKQNRSEKTVKERK